MPVACLPIRPLRLADLALFPKLSIHGLELPTLTDPFGIDDWRTCPTCDAHTPHAATTCLACAPLPRESLDAA